MCLNLTEHVGSIIITYKGTASNIIISARKR